jgi:hypothetical protein
VWIGELADEVSVLACANQPPEIYSHEAEDAAA